MPRKLDYNHPKVQEIIMMLIELAFKYTQNKDSIDVEIPTKEDRKKLSHELHKIFHEFKTPPLTTQYDESSRTISIFDQRV